MLKGENMICLRRIVVVGVVVWSLGLPVAWAESDPNTEIADHFKVSLDSAKYAASTSLILSSEDRSEGVAERLRIDCEVDIADANLVLGISRRGTITQVESDEGEIVDVVDQKASGRMSMLYIYHTPRYRRQFVAPPKVPKWKTAIRSVLRLPPLKGTLPQWSDKLIPSRMTLELDAGIFGSDAEKVSRVEGHLHVLMAESLENIDIPFKPNKEWVRLTPDLEIRVLEARTTGSQHNFHIETRRWKRTFTTPFSPASNVPNRYPVDRQLLGKDGRVTGRRSGPIFGLASIGGGGGGSGMGPEKIRFVIAVHPTHHKIPFVLEDIPLPSPAVAASIERPTRPAPRARQRPQAVSHTSFRPPNKTIQRQTWMQLSWEPGSGADSYDVYMGESFEDVNDGVSETFRSNQTGTGLPVGFPGFPFPDGLVPGQTYYWRVDEVNKSEANGPRKGKVTSFSIAPTTAFNPFPADGAESVSPNVTLRWTEGLRAKLHTVYFGDNLKTVTNAGDGRPQSGETFAPGVLKPGTTYYWRVDEFDARKTYKGKVWSFAVDEAAESRKISD